MKKITFLCAILSVLLTGCEGEVKGLEFNDGYLEIKNVSELRYISEVSHRNASSKASLKTKDGIEIPFNEAKLRLMKDIVIRNEWSPIKCGRNGSFKIIDGNHHSITFKNLKIELSPSMMDSTDRLHPINYGLFDKLEQCEIKNLKLNGDISLVNNMQDGFDVYVGVLAGQLYAGVRLVDIVNAVNISFIDDSIDEIGNAKLNLGGIAGIMDGGNDGIGFYGKIINEGNLRADGCQWTQIGGICASITQNVMFGPDVTIENKGNITAELSKAFFISNNFIGGIFGEYRYGEKNTIHNEYGHAKEIKNEGKILVVDYSYTDALYAIGGICGWAEGLRKRISSMDNLGQIEIKGDHLRNHQNIDDLIGR